MPYLHVLFWYDHQEFYDQKGISNFFEKEIPSLSIKQEI